LDPLDCSNLSGVHDYVRSLGFHKTYFGQIYHAGYFEREVRRIHCEDPDARFALIGFNCGAGKVRDIALAVKPDNIHIDLLVYLGGCALTGGSCGRPENVTYVLNIQADSCIGKRVPVCGAENVDIHKVGYLGSPSHPFTLEMLAQELTALASSVPVPVPVPPAIPPEEAAPTPRPLQAQSEQPRDEWDFLKPVSRVGRRTPPGDRP
jgi:hypothetical protein